jgi:hypothetical protein
MKIIFKILAKINKILLPSMTKKGVDPIKASKLSVFNYRLEILYNKEQFRLIF